MSAGGTATKSVLGGTAVVCCVHDRVKREVTTESDVVRIGLESGIVFDPVQHKIHRCACCDNLFADPSDIPVYCHGCRSAQLVHPLGGPLNDPIGVVDG